MAKRSASQPRRSQDTAYKRLFSHPEMVADLIRGYVDRRVAKRFDLSTLERCNGSYVSPDLRERRNDVVWRMRSASGWTYVYLLLEFQSTVDRFMAVRLLGYIALLWQDLIAQKTIPADGLLPPVLPIVLYNGDRPWTAPRHLRELIASTPAFLSALQPSSSYHFLDESRVPTIAGMRLRNLASAIFALEQTQGLAAQRKVIATLRTWLKDRPDLREALGTWYAESLAPTGLLRLPRNGRITIDEVEPMMATRILKDIQRQVAEGKAEGKAEGMIDAIRQLVRSGALSIDAARVQIRALAKTKKLSTSLAKAALIQLG
ncbi:MAG: Rpn family recombination-promoting nuclease/putative transposase [Planctomycetes bacterium]|nr:Rpn family recombination-promoting nuclease/putative transposase [Planctomycetota bacterium]